MVSGGGGHLFGLGSAARVAVPPGLQSGHQQGQQQPRRQDAEDAGEAVQPQGPALWLGVGVAVQVAAAPPGPPLLLQDVQVPLLLELQDPEAEGENVRTSRQRICYQHGRVKTLYFQNRVYSWCSNLFISAHIGFRFRFNFIVILQVQRQNLCIA